MSPFPNPNSLCFRFTPRGVVSVMRARKADAVDITVTEYVTHGGITHAYGRTVTKRLWRTSPWYPDLMKLLEL